MRTIKLILILFFLFSSIYNKAQKTNNLNCLNIKEGKIAKENVGVMSIRNLKETSFLLDSVLSTYYLTDWDSMLYTQDYYKYDNKGNKIEWIHRSTCINCSSGGNYKYEYSYDEVGNCILEFYYNLNLITFQWKLVYKLEQEYITNGNLLGYVFYLPQNNSDELINYSKVEYTYNDSNKLTNKMEYSWNENLSEWSFSMKWEWKFNNIGQLEQNKSFSYDLINELWTSIGKAEHFYDTRGYDSVQIQADWNVEKEIWNNYTKYEYSFDSIGNEIGFSVFRKDTTEPWQGYNKIINAFDEKGNKVLSEEYYWENEKSDWAYFKKKEWDFDDRSQLIKEVSFRWESSQYKWENSSKIEWDYDLNNQMILQVSSIWNRTIDVWINRSQITYDYDVNNNIMAKNLYESTDDNVWQLRENTEYYYSELVTNISNDINDFRDIKIYPNPANEIITIESQNSKSVIGKLYNSNGTLIKNLKVEQGINIFHISELKSGVYIIQVYMKDKMVVKKLIIE